MKKLHINQDQDIPTLIDLITKRCCLLIVFSSVTVSLLSSCSTALAASTDDDFSDLLVDLCIFNPPTNPSQELIDLCIETIRGGGLGGGSGSGVSSNLNTGVTGAQGRTSTALTEKLRQGISDRLEEIEEEREKGDRASGDNFFSNWDVFLSGYHSERDRTQTELENGYDSEEDGGLLGLDYRFSNEFTAGLAVGYSEDDADFDSNAGDLDTKSWSLTAYGNLMPIDNMFLNAYVGYAEIDYDSKRNVNFGLTSGTVIRSGVAKGTTDGRQILAGFSAGYSWNYFSDYGALSINPEIKLDYSNTDIEGYKEQGTTDLELEFDEQHIRSLTMSAGGNIAYTISVPWGTIVPQTRLFYVHEYKDDSRKIPGSLVIAPTGTLTSLTDNPDRNYIIWGAGMSSVFAYGIQTFIDYEQLSNHRFLDSWTITAGIRLEL